MSIVDYHCNVPTISQGHRLIKLVLQINSASKFALFKESIVSLLCLHKVIKLGRCGIADMFREVSKQIWIRNNAGLDSRSCETC